MPWGRVERLLSFSVAAFMPCRLYTVTRSADGFVASAFTDAIPVVGRGVGYDVVFVIQRLRRCILAVGRDVGERHGVLSVVVAGIEDMYEKYLGC